MTTPSGPTAVPYRGEDRRRRVARSAPAERLAAAVALTVLCLLALIWIIGPFVAPSRPLEDTSRLMLLFDSAALAVALVIGMLCVVRWRMVGQAWTLWMAGASFTYALVTLTTGYVLPDLLPSGSMPFVLLWLHPASRIVAIGLLIEALRAPDVDAGLRAARVWVAAVAGIGVLTVAFQLTPWVGVAMAGVDDPLVRTLNSSVGSVVLIVLYAGLGCAYLLRGGTARRALFLWFGVLLWSFAFAELHRMTVSEDTFWGVGDGVLRLTGLLAVAAGLIRDLVSNFREQGGRLFESVASGATAEARMRADRAANEERAHEARNALAAIEGATRTLEHYRDRLDAETRSGLAQAITEEIARLQDLIAGVRSRSDPAPFGIERALRTVITAARSDDVQLTASIPTDLKAVGRPAETAEVVQNLLVNARRYAPGSPIDVRAGREQGGVVVRVEDRGPGVPEEERRTIFSRGVRGTQGQRTGSEGSGLGLYVSLELMREQDGYLWVEDREGGGASFALWLPAADEDSPQPDEHEQGEPADRAEGRREQARADWA